jgi:hypothetical protein
MGKFLPRRSSTLANAVSNLSLRTAGSIVPIVAYVIFNCSAIDLSCGITGPALRLETI